MNSKYGPFAEALSRNPLDHSTRLIYADWLDEEGLSDDADRQRKFVPAFLFLAEFTEERYNQNNWNDSEGNLIIGPDGLDYSRVLAEIAYWEETIRNRTPDIVFGSDYAQEAMSDPDTRKKFWDCFQTVTGTVPPQVVVDQEWYRCAC